MQLRMTIPENEVDEQTLNSALETATVLAARQAPYVPPITQAIRDGLRWRPGGEPAGQEHFTLPVTVVKRGWGDCNQLAPYHAGYLRAMGIDPGARSVAKQSGPHRWHALVQRSDGRIEDPSKWAGMPTKENPRGSLAPAVAPLAGYGRSSLAMKSVAGPAFISRVDLPLVNARHGLAICSSDRQPVRALYKSLRGTALVGRALNQPHAILGAAVVRGARGDMFGADPRTCTLCCALERVLKGENADDVANVVGIEPATVRQFIATARDILATVADELFNGPTYGGQVYRARKVKVEGAGRTDERTVGRG